MRTEFLYISVLREASGPRKKLVSRKSALTSPPRPYPVVHSTDRSKAVVPVLVFPFVLVVCLLLFCFCVFRSFEHCDYLAWGRES